MSNMFPHREPGSDVGMFEYSFEPTKPCRSITVFFESEVFKNGEVLVNVIADDTTICVRSRGEQELDCMLMIVLPMLKSIRFTPVLIRGNTSHEPFLSRAHGEPGWR